MTTTLDKLIDLITRSIDVGLGREAFAFAGVALQQAPLQKEPRHMYKIHLEGIRDNMKIRVIKAIREITNLGLKEAKEMSEQPGALVVETPELATAIAAKAQLEEAGGLVSMRCAP